MHDIRIYFAEVTLQFNTIEYSVNEGGAIEFMLELSGPADRQVTVLLTTFNGSALGWLYINTCTCIQIYMHTYIYTYVHACTCK